MNDLSQGNAVAGIRKVTKAVESDCASMVYIAQDADLFIKNRLRAACEAHGVRVLDARSMKELGASCGIEVGAAAAAILKD